MKRTNRLVLAPMAGVTDAVFRQIAHEKGCNYSYTEMVSAKGLYFKNLSTKELLEIDPEKEGNVVIQIFGSDPKIMGWAAKELEGRPSAGIDINMGCPVPKVYRNGEGSALLLQKELAMQIVSSVKENTKKPVSVKMRIGINRCVQDDGSRDQSKNTFDYVDFAKGLESAGADLISVHARTREDYYSGKADWQAIKEIKAALHIPVIGNGDIRNIEDADRMQKETLCDACMIGRGAMGNPWAFAEYLPSKEEITDTINHHLDLAVMRYGENKAVREARKQISWYTKGIKGASLLRNKLNCASSRDALSELLKEI